eukprot:256791_1
MHGMGCQRPGTVCIGMPVVSSPSLRDDGFSSDEKNDNVNMTYSVRDLVQSINLRCSNLGRTLPMTMTVGDIGHSTGPWNKDKYYPDCTHRAVLPSPLLEKDSSKGEKIPISTHK